MRGCCLILNGRSFLLAIYSSDPRFIIEKVVAALALNYDLVNNTVTMNNLSVASMSC